MTKMGWFDVEVHASDACSPGDGFLLRPGLVLTEAGKLMVNEGGTLRPAGMGDVMRFRVKGDKERERESA
jgi:hypothetical protein